MSFSILSQQQTKTIQVPIEYTQIVKKAPRDTSQKDYFTKKSGFLTLSEGLSCQEIYQQLAKQTLIDPEEMIVIIETEKGETTFWKKIYDCQKVIVHYEFDYLTHYFCKN
jgi:hypothetical protein